MVHKKSNTNLFSKELQDQITKSSFYTKRTPEKARKPKQHQRGESLNLERKRYNLCREPTLGQVKFKAYEKIFRLLDSDNDNKISACKIDITSKLSARK